MKLLAIDTTEDACSAALLVGHDVLERFELAPRRHSELILPMMDGLLAEAGLRLSQLDALAFARGPGGFTGVRIATSIVQGAAFGADLPVVAVSSLQALAQGAARAHAATAALSAFDARMGEVYWGAYRIDGSGVMRAVLDECVCPPQRVTVPGGTGWIGIGSGWRSYSVQLAAAIGFLPAHHGDSLVRAHDVARVGAALFSEGMAVPAEQALPVYLRNEVAWAKP